MTNNKQQTAVEIIESALDKYFNYEYNKNKATPFVKFDLYESLKQAKEMEKEKHEKFNKFLNDEKQLGISDLKTVERIQWYYNTYFNETYGGGEQ